MRTLRRERFQNPEKIVNVINGSPKGDCLKFFFGAEFTCRSVVQFNRHFELHPWQSKVGRRHLWTVPHRGEAKESKRIKASVTSLIDKFSSGRGQSAASLFEKFNNANCPSVTGIPKLFIFQDCGR